MLSFGIEAAFAFSTAFWSARLPAGSGPPSFAATMIARVSLEKSLPRFASAAPFLCLIDDHLLCQDTSLLPHDVQEAFVDASIVGQLRMEGSDEQPSLARQHRMAVDLREHLDVGSRLLEPRRPDEDSFERLVAVTDVEIRLEAAHLAAERVAPRPVVAEAEVVAVEDDHPGARAEDRAAEPAHRLVEAVQPHEPADRGRLPARDDQAVEPRQLLGEPDLGRLRAESPQDGGVLAEVPLQGENADPERLLHASMVTRATRASGRPAEVRQRRAAAVRAGRGTRARSREARSRAPAPIGRAPTARSTCRSARSPCPC